MAATASTAFNDATNFVRLLTDADCFISLAGTASTTIGTNDSFKLLAGVYLDVAVLPGQTLSAIMSTGSATLQIIEFSGTDYKGNQNVLGIIDVQSVSVTT